MQRAIKVQLSRAQHYVFATFLDTRLYGGVAAVNPTQPLHHARQFRRVEGLDGNLKDGLRSEYARPYAAYFGAIRVLSRRDSHRFVGAEIFIRWPLVMVPDNTLPNTSKALVSRR
ncbi:L-serine dehydratase 1, putative [Babesia ovata]|uniref:L-serine dehydratase 1, putative n=1 Tax=Babesia ovata TaxID=189622 RepID=A0A2H6KES9_9APIC|nr:L-serine dehydratase 1, putative [Babesia ovata]GBE61510.1 L-serine dehydratase 1, putative [Babesia ovata]